MGYSYCPTSEESNVPRLTSFQTQGSISKGVSKALLYDIWKFGQKPVDSENQLDLRNISEFHGSLIAILKIKRFQSLFKNQTEWTSFWELIRKVTADK